MKKGEGDMVPMSGKMKNRTLARRLPYLQVLLVVLAFGLMVYFSYIFFSIEERGHLRNDAMNVLTIAQQNIEGEMKELEMVVNTFSRSVRYNILNGASAESIEEYIARTPEFVFMRSDTTDFHSAYGYFDVFGGKYVSSGNLPVPDDFRPQERPWYLAAVKAGGKLAISEPFVSVRTGDTVISYSQQLLDEEGNQLGVVGVNVTLDRIRNIVSKTKLTEDGYGVLACDSILMVHPTKEGTHLKEMDTGAEISRDVELEKDIFEHRIKAMGFEGRPAVLFFKRISNGWYVGVITPREQYYAGMHNMMWILISLGAAMAFILSAILLRINAAKNRADATLFLSEYEIMKYRLTSDALSIALWDMEVISADPVNPVNHFTWSREFRHMLGFSDTLDFPDLLQSWSNRLHPEDRERTLAAFAAHINDFSGKTPYDIEYRLQLKNGPYRHFRAFGNTLRDSGGLPLRVAGALMDITEIKKVQDDIEEKNELIHAMFENAPVGLTVFDENFRFIDCNEAVLGMYGVTREFYSGFFGGPAHSPEFQPDGSNSREKAAKLIRRVMEGETVKVEWMHSLPNGEPLPVELTMTRLHRGDRFIGLGYIYDMREQIRLKGEIETALTEAREASRIKSEFLSRMSHELRTPMNAVIGMAEIQLQQGNHPPKTEEAFSLIYNSGNLLLHTINDILDLSRIEAGRLEIAPVRYDIPSIIYDTMQMNILRYEDKPIEFNLNVDEDMPLDMYGDELRIKQVLNNILSNAFKYTDQGEIELSVGVEALQAPPPPETPEALTKCVLVLSVRDTGQGMSGEQVEALFDEYVRFNIEANRAVIGAGLGMNITKHLVSLMDGEIKVESEPGKGSVFTVRLPQERIGSAVCGPELAKNLRQNRFLSIKSKKLHIAHEYMPYGSILIVDDVESNLYVAKGMMVPYGLKIETATCGIEAVEKIKSGKVYDIIFMDHMMPRMNGLEATKIIREMGYARSIVALTANALAGMAEMFLANGFDGYISKPIDMRELNASLNRLVRDKYPPEVVKAARQEKTQKETESTVFIDALQSLADFEKVTTDAVALSKNETPEIGKYFILDAENAINVMKDVSAKTDELDDADLEAYIVAVHGIKNVLANIGETELSDLSLKLEKAGLDRNLPVITDETSVLIEALQALVEKFKPKETGGSVEMSHDDTVFLRERLSDIKTACEIFQLKAAETALTELKQKTWPRGINDILDEISVDLLCGEFKKVASVAEKTANMHNS